MKQPKHAYETVCIRFDTLKEIGSAYNRTTCGSPAFEAAATLSPPSMSATYILDCNEDVVRTPSVRIHPSARPIPLFARPNPPVQIHPSVCPNPSVYLRYVLVRHMYSYPSIQTPPFTRASAYWFDWGPWSRSLALYIAVLSPAQPPPARSAVRSSVRHEAF